MPMYRSMWCSDCSDSLMLMCLFVQLWWFDVSVLTGSCDVVIHSSLPYLCGVEWRALDC
jgi:hypothetical protein